MLALHHDPRGPEPLVPDAPGAFAWWYLDLVAPDGRGLVVIWSFGLPFLPGYADAYRRGSPQLPADRPSINVVLYEQGRETLYLLQEHPPEEATAAGGRVAIGASRFVTEELDGRRSVLLELDCPIPGSAERLTGTVRASGPGVVPDRSGAGPHRWTPLLAAAEGAAALAIGERALPPLVGRVYHDRNVSELALDALGIDRWLWGRAPHADGELVWYVAWPEDGGEPECLAVEIGRDGAARVTRPRVALGRPARAWFGMRYWPEATLHLDDGRALRVTTDAVLDDGPFYLRLATRVEGGPPGFGEILAPARVDRALERPLVRMAVHQPGGGNSMWLPLFSGPRAGRLGRLVSGMFGGVASPRRAVTS